MHKVIRRLIALIDSEIEKQILEVLQNQEFQQLNATWSSLYYIIDLSTASYIRIKIFNTTWEEIACSFGQHEEVLNSPIAHKIIKEYDTPGAAPFSVIIGDYHLDVFNPDTIEILSHMAKVSNAAFAPFVTTITPKIFNVEKFCDLATLQSLYIFNRFNHLLKLANDQSASFIGLVVPNILYPSLLNLNRRKYCPILGTKIINFNEVLGNASYSFVGVLIQSFIDTGWFLDITGIPQDNQITQSDGLGVIPKIRSSKILDTQIPFGFFKSLTECFISDATEEALSNLGFITICQVKNRDFAVVYNVNSFKTLSESNSDRCLSSSLVYILCACRFAHYIKVIARQKIGKYTNPSELQYYLNSWLYQFISSDPDSSNKLKHRYPLAQAYIELEESKELHDSVHYKITISPHMKTSNINTYFQFNITLALKY